MCCLSKVWWLSSCCKSSRSTDNYAGENSAVPIQPVLARITVRPGKQSSPELQRLQFPITLAWTSTVHKVLGLTLNEVVVSAMLCQ